MSTSYLSSNLSDGKYTYDLVLGTTAKAINQTLKMYLFKDPPAPKEIWYQKPDISGPVTPMTPIQGIDPFSIHSKDDVPETLLNSNFSFAIKAGFGLPPGVSPLSVPDILMLTTDKQKVNYNMFFNTFQICTLDWGAHGRFAWNNYAQPSGTPYVFTFEVDMNFDPADPTDKFSGLPPDVQQKLQNYNANTMFSVQQLYLDLNSAGLQSLPTITGVPSNSDVYLILTKDFINTYWQDMQKSSQFVLGYAIHTNSQPASHASLQPTSLNFMTVPFYDDNGNITDNHKLYTLNYLMDTNNRQLNVGGAFNWNWVKADQVNDYHGAMAVRREVFAEYLINAISPWLSYIAITPTTTYDQSSAGLSWSASTKLNQTPNQKFTYDSAAGSKIASFAFSAQSHHSDKSGLISGHYNLDASASGSISISGKEITIVVDADMNIDFNNGDIGGAGAVKGLAGGYTNTAIFEVSVDGSGKITVKDKDGYPKSQLKAEDLSKGSFSGIDGVDGLTDSLKNLYKNMTDRMNSFAPSVEDYLNSAGGQWIFPGGQTLIFKDAAFSEHQDFVTHVTYADPA